MTNKILVVDDDPVSLELVQTRLTAHGYEVIICKDGREGLETAKKEIPALVITDVLMPEMDGFLFFKELKKDASTAVIPVIIVTARGKMEDSFIAVGVESFLSKPLNIDRLLSEICRLVKFTPQPKPQESQGTPQIPTPPKEEKTPQTKEEGQASQKTKVDDRIEVSAADVRKKVLLFGLVENVNTNISRQLLEEKCHVVIINEEAKILPEFDNVYPNIIFLQFNAKTQTPIDEIIAALTTQIKKRFKELSSQKNRTQTLLAPSAIILYKAEEERDSGIPSQTELADTESLLQRCQENGASKYIGLYSSVSFVSKIKEFLN